MKYGFSSCALLVRLTTSSNQLFYLFIYCYYYLLRKYASTIVILFWFRWQKVQEPTTQFVFLSQVFLCFDKLDIRFLKGTLRVSFLKEVDKIPLQNH